MELNEVHTEHEHASTSLKVVLLIFVITLVAALGYLVWVQNSDPDATDYSAPSVKKTETKTETAATDETEGWKTYTNTGLGFSFKYPASYAIDSDTLPDTPTEQIQLPSKKLVLKDTTAASKPTLTLYINTDGFGPTFNDLRYTLGISGSKLTLSSRETIESSENNDDGVTYITATSGTNKLGKNYFLVHFTFNEGGTDLEQQFKTIISTFSVE